MSLCVILGIYENPGSLDILIESKNFSVAQKFSLNMLCFLS